MSEASNKHTVAVSTGNPSGCSPELIRPLIDQCPDHLELSFVGPLSLAETIDFESLEGNQSDPKWVESGEVSPEAVLSGNLTPETGQVAYESLVTAVELCESGDAEGLLTLPLSKKAVHGAGHTSFRGHTAFFEDYWDCRSVMTFFGDVLNVALLTRHIPYRSVPETLSIDFIIDQVRTVNSYYESVASGDPRLAILGLNPHAGEENLIGSEESDVIEPAIERLNRSHGLSVDGPFPADSFFPVHAERYDCVFACYHDQGLIPFKMNDFYTGVHATLGLPVPRVSPDHGVAADLAGQGSIDERSAVNSLRHLGRWLPGG